MFFIKILQCLLWNDTLCHHVESGFNDFGGWLFFFFHRSPLLYLLLFPRRLPIKKPHLSIGEMGSSYSTHGTLFARVNLQAHRSAISYHRILFKVKGFAALHTRFRKLGI